MDYLIAPLLLRDLRNLEKLISEELSAMFRRGDLGIISNLACDISKYVDEAAYAIWAKTHVFDWDVAYGIHARRVGPIRLATLGQLYTRRSSRGNFKAGFKISKGEFVPCDMCCDSFIMRGTGRSIAQLPVPLHALMDKTEGNIAASLDLLIAKRKFRTIQLALWNLVGKHGLRDESLTIEFQGYLWNQEGDAVPVQTSMIGNIQVDPAMFCGVGQQRQRSWSANERRRAAGNKSTYSAYALTPCPKCNSTGGIGSWRNSVREFEECTRKKK